MFVTLQAASMLLADRAQAQANACEQLKDKLAARIDPSIRGFSLEVVPAATPTPSGAKVVGTCEGGAQKVLYRRHAAAGSPPASASVAAPAAAPAPAPKVIAAPALLAPLPPPQSARVQNNRAVPATASPPLASAVAPSPDPIDVPLPVSGLNAAASAVAVAVAVAIDKTPAIADVPAQALSGSVGVEWPWRWLWALLALPLAAWLWVRTAHRRAYDEAGLPRGPKITL